MTLILPERFILPNVSAHISDFQVKLANSQKRVSELEVQVSELEQGRRATRTYIMRLEEEIAGLRQRLESMMSDRDSDHDLHLQYVEAARTAGVCIERERFENSVTWKAGRLVMAPVRAMRLAKRLVISSD